MTPEEIKQLSADKDKKKKTKEPKNYKQGMQTYLSLTIVAGVIAGLCASIVYYRFSPTITFDERFVAFLVAIFGLLSLITLYKTVK